MEDEHKAAVRMDEDMNESSALDTDAHETRSSAKTAHAVEHARTTGHTSTEAQSSDETRNEAPAQDSDGRQPMLLDDALTADSAPSIGSLDAASNQPEFDANIAQPSVDEGDSLMPDVPTTTAVGGSHSDDEQTNVNAVVDEDADEPPVPTHLDVEESESEYEINDDPHCYCRLPWDGDEKMIECDNCRVWYHFDCMGIPLTREFTSADRFTCDSCLSLSSLPPNVFPLPRRDRRKEKAKEEERRRKRERVRQEKKRGLTKEQRAAIRSKERLARRKEREVNQAKTTAKATKDGLKNLLAQFDDDYSSESSSEEESSEEDSPPPPPKATKKPLTAKPGGSSAAVAGKAGVPASPSNAKVAHAPPRKPVIASLDSIRKKVRESLAPLVGAELGTAVEAALFQHHAAAGNTTKYIAQWRDIMANLKDEKNDLKSRVTSGVVTPSALASMASKDLASSEMSQQREQIRKAAVKDSVRAVSPPRDKSMLHHGKSLISGEDRPMNDDIINQAIASHQVQRDDVPTTPKSSTARLPPSKPAVKGAPSTSSLLASLPQLGSYEDVIRSMEEAKQRKREAIEVDSTTSSDAPKSSPADSAAARRQRRAELQAKNAAILKAANERIRKENAEQGGQSEEERDPDAPPKPEAVSPAVKKPVGGKSATEEEPELAYQDLNLPPMDVWNGDLLLSAGANPSVLTNYFPLIARQIAGPPVLTLPLPSRIDEVLRLKVDEVQKYVQLVAQRGSKKIVLVEMTLNTGTTSSAKTSTMQEDFASFCAGYLKKNKALAFDYQKDPDPTNRLLLYLIPPDTQTHLTPEFVRKYLRAPRPNGKMWGIFILPREAYQPIAKRISKLHLQKMQQQAKAVEKYNAMHASPEVPTVTAPTTVASPPPVVQTIRPQDPRRAAQARAAEAAAAAAAAASASSGTTEKADATTSESVSPPVSSSTSAASSAASTPGLAALLKNTASLDAFSSMLSNLVAKTSGTGASVTAPAPAPALAAFPPPAPTVTSFRPPPPPASAVATPVGIPSFPPPPMTSLPMPPRALPMPPPPMPPMQMNHPPQMMQPPPPPQQQMMNPQFAPPPHQQQHPHQQMGLPPPPQMGLPPPPHPHQLPPPPQPQQQQFQNSFQPPPHQVQPGFTVIPPPQQLQPPSQQQNFGGPPGRLLPLPPAPHQQQQQQQQHPQLLPPPLQQVGQPFPSMLGKHGRDEQPAGVPHEMQPPAQRSRFGPPMSAGGGPAQPQQMPMMPMPPPPQQMQQLPLPPPTRVIPPGASGVCDFFFSSNGCRKGATCQFTHDIQNERAQEIMQQRGIPPHLAQAVQAMGGLRPHGQQQGLPMPPQQSPQRNTFAPPPQNQNLPPPQQRGLPPPPPPMMQMSPQQQQQQQQHQPQHFNGPPPPQQQFSGPPPPSQMNPLPHFQPQFGHAGPAQQSPRMLPPPPMPNQGLPPPNWNTSNLPHQQQQQFNGGAFPMRM